MLTPWALGPKVLAPTRAETEELNKMQTLHNLAPTILHAWHARMHGCKLLRQCHVMQEAPGGPGNVPCRTPRECR